MIPHHSIAVLTSRRAEISDPRVRELADAIIEAKVKEIAQMELLLEDIETNGKLGDGTPLPLRTAALTPELQAEAEAAIGRKITPENARGIGFPAIIRSRSSPIPSLPSTSPYQS